MRVAIGLMRARTGTVRLFGVDSWDTPAEIRKRIGYVPQRFSGFGWMTVDACLAMIGAHYDSWDQALINDLKREWRLANRKIDKLSPGDQQKVAIMLAVGHKPDLLFLDEPAASLDATARRNFMKALVEMNVDRRQTVLLSSHIISDIERVASHIAVLHNGRITCHGLFLRPNASAPSRGSVQRVEFSVFGNQCQAHFDCGCGDESVEWIPMDPIEGASPGRDPASEGSGHGLRLGQ